MTEPLPLARPEVSEADAAAVTAALASGRLSFGDRLPAFEAAMAAACSRAWAGALAISSSV